MKNYVIGLVPTKVSELQNDSGYLTTETDPTVPSWAKAQTKPSYTADEVGAASVNIVANQYDSSSTYAVGDIVLYNGSLYKCNTAISVAENFDYHKWDHTTVDLTYAKNADLAAVATSGSYNDLSNKPTIPTVPVQDVQINGTSILSNGVANILNATSDRFGVAMFGSGFSTDQLTGKTNVDFASASNIKAGATQAKAVNPYAQHRATFYGLAKAAGVDMASSSNAVGTYTEAAKVAIQKMLGIYEPPYELIRNITLSERTSLDITVDDNGLPFELLGVFVEVLYAENLTSESSGYGRYHFYDSDDNYLVAETGKYVTNANKQYKDIFIVRNSNLTHCLFSRISTTGNYVNLNVKCMPYRGTLTDLKSITKIKMHSSDFEPIGTNIKIYGQRAY